MKHKTIKKSIVIIMIATLLLTCVSSLAASIATENITISVNNQYIIQVDEIIEEDNVYYGIYRFVVQFNLVPTSTGYYNGYLKFNCSWSNSSTVKWGSYYIDVDEDLGNDSTFFATPTYYGPSYLGTQISMFFNNCYLYTGAYNAGPTLHIEVCIQQTTNAFSAQAFSFSLSDAAGICSKTDYPEVGIGLAGVIGMSVLHAINSGDFNTALDTIEVLIATSNSILNDVLDELETNNVHLSDLVYYMNNVQNTRLQTIISKIQELIDMGRQDTQAQNDLNAAASQMEGAAAAMNVTKPNMAAVIPQTLADADAVAAQGTIFSWLNNSYIITILSAMMTIALIGFVLYGKSG